MVTPKMVGRCQGFGYFLNFCSTLSEWSSRWPWWTSWCQSGSGSGLIMGKYLGTHMNDSQPPLEPLTPIRGQKKRSRKFSAIQQFFQQFSIFFSISAIQQKPDEKAFWYLYPIYPSDIDTLCVPTHLIVNVFILYHHHFLLVS